MKEHFKRINGPTNFKVDPYVRDISDSIEFEPVMTKGISHFKASTDEINKKLAFIIFYATPNKRIFFENLCGFPDCEFGLFYHDSLNIVH